MLTDKKIFGKLKHIAEAYLPLRWETVQQLPAEVAFTREHFRSPAEAQEALEFKPAKAPLNWGESWLSAWFLAKVRVPKELAGKPLFLRAKTGGETLFFVDNEPNGVFDENHPVVRLTGAANDKHTYEAAFETYAGHEFPGTQPHETGRKVTPGSLVFEGVDLLLEREDVSAFVFDLEVLLRLFEALDEHSLRKGELARGLKAVFALVDAVPLENPESHWRPRLQKAREVMQPLLAKRNGPTTPVMGIIGHSHIDTAWLWPLAETWRKCARTFSSVANLMEQYPEFLFIQSSPAQTVKVQELYPGLFKRIKALVAEGRWEPNGAMWVEPDCNVPSGEALARQLLFGQLTTRRLFGYTADTLWLPDVFGYSAALPQLLQSAGVKYFCTTKLSWNDTTRFPYDTFWWKGIDGTAVLAHYNTIHCWPEPKTLVDQWKWVQHKDVQKGRLVAFGYGDGGGGPMAEMVESARRCQDLEGCPKAKWTTVSDFMQQIERDWHDLPAWEGELYLELHRGTLTSIAKVKRGNRKSEFALREAEFLATLALLEGGAYPADQLGELWRALLTNQFHDILPGSSIKEVNDEAIETFELIIQGARQVASKAAQDLGAQSKGKKLLVFNSLSWERTGEVVLPGVPEGMAVAEEGALSQVVETPTGERKLIAAGLNLPPLGAKLVSLGYPNQNYTSPFKVTSDSVETPFAVVRFDEAGRLVSLLDKASGREVAVEGKPLNTFYLGEDLPEAWDNWDIDSDQALKLEPVLELLSREVVSDGPLQLRLRSTYALGNNSRLVQDMVFHSLSPQIDFETVLDWSEKHKLLKVGFAVNVLCENARHEIQYGHVQRPTHRNLPQDRARFEVCAHKWSDLSEANFGVALLNDCKYGVSVHGKELRLTLIKSGTHPDARGDEGRHEFTYSLLPHAGGFNTENVIRPAYELNLQPSVFKAPAKAEPVPSLLQLSEPNVIVEAVKAAEEGEGVIFRLYETERTATTCHLAFGRKPKQVQLVNLLEETVQTLEAADDGLTLEFKPFEIKTLKVSFES